MKKTPLVVNICPSLFCNNRCRYCYISDSGRSKLHPLLDLDVLEQRLEEIKAEYEVPKVNLYGGEITLLSQDYLRDLKAAILRHVPDIWISQYAALSVT